MPYTQERDLMAIGLIVMFSNLLTIMSAFEFIGVLILTVYRMLTRDVLQFLIVYIVLLYGFATAMHVLVYDSAVEDPEDLKGLDVSPNQVMMRFVYIYIYVCMYVCILCDMKSVS